MTLHEHKIPLLNAEVYTHKFDTYILTLHCLGHYILLLRTKACA